MNDQELEKARKTFEEMGIQFYREGQIGTGPVVGGILTSVKDRKGNQWNAIGECHLNPDQLSVLRVVLQTIADNG